MKPAFQVAHEGPLAFPITPFNADGSLDLNTFREHLHWLLLHEPPALFVACGAGEFPSLAVNECRQLVEAAVETVGPDLPVYAGAGQGLPLAKQFARAAEEAGASGLLVFPPYLIRGEQDGLIGYYGGLAEATSLPLVIYQRANAVFEIETVLRLMEIPTIVGLKDGVGEIERIQGLVNTVGSRLTYFNGMPTAETYQPAYAAMGVTNYSSAIFNFVPEISWAFNRALVSHDEELAGRLMRSFFLPLAELRSHVKGYAVALVKAGVETRWGPVGPVRAPLVDVTKEHRDALSEVIDRGLAELAESRVRHT